ncbi:MAG TPA: polysaccharide biosynthesis tyrosine autokinase [Gemmatimonadaceae bacterium]|jgi:capsular exopolysaccharide synthesis family protein|nr:polysaccharide biosynthesis tyrosine autokinase [Gemmatimonadaceae bacterium]
MTSPSTLGTTLVETDPMAITATLPVAESPEFDEFNEEDENGESSILLKRSIAAVYRYKWLILVSALLATAAGYKIKGQFSPEYEAEGRVWVTPTIGEGGTPATAPVRAATLLPSNSWSDLLASYAVVGGVVRELHLYIHPANSKYDRLFSTADVGERVKPGTYTIRVDNSGTHYRIVTGLGKEERVVEQGSVGDSLGRSIGLRWVPDRNVLATDHTIGFWLTTPRLAAAGVQGSLRSVLPWQGNIMRVYVTGSDPWRVSQVANALVRHLVQTADDFKRRNLTEVRKSLDVQLTFASRALQEADSALEQFRKATITLPQAATAGQGSPDAAEYFRLKVSRETVAHERAALESTLSDIQTGKLDVQALWQVLPAAGGTQDIGTLLQEYAKKQSQLRNDLLAFTEDYQGIKETRASIADLRDHVIPGVVGTLVAQLKRRETDLDQQLTGASAGLQTIPPRMVEEVTLTRDVDARRQLYDMLQRRVEEARLSELSVEPDLAILDAPNMPEWPISNKGRQVFLMAAVGGLGAAVVLALVLDRLDKRLRFLPQVSARLKLRVLASVPHAKRRRKPDPLNSAQLVEAFRSLRMNATYAASQGRRFMLAVTSANPSEGKSFVSANLALAFAESGFRTVLVDGDVRRGCLHATFDADRCPGLVDVLRGSAPLTGTLVPTAHPKLTLLPCGTRDTTAPELLASHTFRQLAEALQAQFDVVLIDTPPLAAGMDPLALCVASGKALFVVRMAHTDGAVARQRLDALERFPVQVIGVVANDVSTSLGMNDEYSYLSSYAITGEEGVAGAPVRVMHSPKAKPFALR